MPAETLWDPALGPQPVTQPVGSSFEERLQLTHTAVEQSLGRMPDNLLEARRLITRELAFEPTPEELQAIVKIAGNASGPGSELPRRLLVLRILAEHELKALFGSRSLDAGSIERCTAVLPRLLRATEQAERAVIDTLDSVDAKDRESLEPVVQALRSPRDDLVAAQVLAPRLELLTRAVQENRVASVAPSLSAGEAAWFTAAAGEPVAADEPSRAVLDALALRSVMQDDLVAWNAALERQADLETRQEILDRFDRDKTAYHVVSARVQEQHDTALAAGLDEFVTSIRQTQRSLFSVYLELSRALGTQAPADGDEPVSEEELRQKCLEAEVAGEQYRTEAEVKEELCTKALGDLEQPAKAVRADPRLPDLRNEKRRVRILASVAAVLFVAVTGVYVFLPGGSTDAPAVLPQELSSAGVRVERLTPMGPLMFAEVSSVSWQQMAEDERRSHVAEMGRTASGRGFDLLHLVDEQARPVATWTRPGGVELAER
jgi:hypothetical protein